MASDPGTHEPAPHSGDCPDNGRLTTGECVGTCDRCRQHRALTESGAQFCPRCDRPAGPRSGDLDEDGIPYL